MEVTDFLSHATCVEERDAEKPSEQPQDRAVGENWDRKCPGLNHRGQSSNLRGQTAWIQGPTVPLTSCQNSGSVNLSSLSLHVCTMGTVIDLYLKG